MIRRFFLALLLFWPLAAVAEEPDLFPQGRLWRIEGPGLAPSYLFGTMHVSDPEILRLPTAVKRAFTESGTFVLEVKLDETAYQAIIAAALLPDGQRLKDLLPPAAYEKLDAALRERGLSAALMDRIQPWVVATILAFDAAEMQRQREGKKALDEMLQNLALASGKEVAALESVEEQLSLFTGMPLDQQVEMLEMSLDSPELLGGATAVMKQLYLAGDQRGLWDYFMTLLEEAPADLRDEFLQAFLYDRNHRMAERARPYLEKGGAFIAVGALHLPGEEGLLHLLALQGFTVTRAD